MSGGTPGPDASSHVSPRASLIGRRSAGKTSIVPYLTAGYPDWDRFDRAAAGLAAAGADVFELGVPFSDPLADGPTIQRASQAALEQGVTLAKILDHVGSHQAAWGLPVVLMTYVNPILAYGIDRFCRDAREAQVGGVLISDLPPEETPELWSKLAEHGIETAVLAAPTTRAGRLPVLAGAATGFLYCVSRTGVTGKGKEFATNLGEQIVSLRAHSDLPIVVGFGIRSAEDAVRVKQTWNPDGVVLGARLIEILEADSGADSRDVSGPAAPSAEAAAAPTAEAVMGDVEMGVRGDYFDSTGPASAGSGLAGSGLAGSGLAGSGLAGPGPTGLSPAGPEGLLSFLSGIRSALDAVVPRS